MSGGYRSIMGHQAAFGLEHMTWTDADGITFLEKDPGDPCVGDRKEGRECTRQALWIWRFTSTPCDHHKFWGEPRYCQTHRETAQARWDAWVKMVMDLCGYQKCGALWSPTHTEHKGCTGTLDTLGFSPIGGK